MRRQVFEFPDVNLTIWADTDVCTPGRRATWGSVRTRYR